MESDKPYGVYGIGKTVEERYDRENAKIYPIKVNMKILDINNLSKSVKFVNFTFAM